MTPPSAAELKAGTSAIREFTNALGREIQAGVTVGHRPDGYARIFIHGPDSGIDSYVLWDELAQLYSAMQEVFASQAPPAGEVEGEPLLLRLALSEVASCSCNTKTYEARYHDSRCLYRVVRDAQVDIERLTALNYKYFWQVRDSCSRAEKAEAALAALSPPIQEAVAGPWQPIETAPRDGTVLDLWILAPDGIHGKREAGVLWDSNRSFNGGFARVAQPDAWVHDVGRNELWLGKGATITHWMRPPSGPPAAAIRSTTERGGAE